MKLSLIIIILLAIAIQSFGQINPGARQIALAHSDFSYSSDVFQIFNNPAGLAFSKYREVGIYYSPAPFDTKEMSNAFAAYSEPTPYGTFSAGFSIYGFDLYKETQFALGFGKKITNNFYVGGTAIYKNLAIKNYGTKGTLLLNLGGIATISDQVGFGFAIENISRSTLSDDSGQIPTVFWSGVHLKVIKEFTFSAALSKEVGYDTSVRLGAEYSMLDFIRLRFGAHNEPNVFSGGFGVIYQFLQVDYAAASHPDLGLTHQFGLILRFVK
ncbi:MAG: helix-hairpin-helix DNA-binding class 1 [Ignavibacteria bacterium]|nr:MAG: helix-hairpin-helix DNA-binding class 1 [Ignavibacteria bacterium]KAF0161767.1 MAG: helix-hairpin-helix DNA-binding class 1 [Ignavibacteria bacterium]